MASHVAGPTYAAMSYPYEKPYRPPRDTGFLLAPGKLYVLADQRRGAPPPVGPIPLWPAAMLAPLAVGLTGARAVRWCRRRRRHRSRWPPAVAWHAATTSAPRRAAAPSAARRAMLPRQETETGTFTINKGECPL